MGRPPKPPEGRVRRNKGQSEWEKITPPKSVPAWPGTKTDPPEARKYWRTVHKELGGMWSDADKMPLYRASMLHAQVLASGRKRGMASRLAKIARGLEDEGDREWLEAMAIDFGFALQDAPAAKALYDIEDKLGISPTSRRRLQWELSKGTGKSDPDTAAPSTDQSRVERQTPTGNTLSVLSG